MWVGRQEEPWGVLGMRIKEILPWKFLYYPDTEHRRGFFLATHPDLVLSRYMPLEMERQTLTPAKGPLRILLVVSAPYNLGPVIADGVMEAIEELAKRYPIQIHSLHKPTINNFFGKVKEMRPHVLHLIGHGQFNREEGNGEIALLDKNGTSAAWVKDEEFVDSLLHTRSISHLIFLNLL